MLSDLDDKLTEHKMAQSIFKVRTTPSHTLQNPDEATQEAISRVIGIYERMGYLAYKGIISKRLVIRREWRGASEVGFRLRDYIDNKTKQKKSDYYKEHSRWLAREAIKYWRRNKMTKNADPLAILEAAETKDEQAQAQAEAQP